jgi:hypothetical protein
MDNKLIKLMTTPTQYVQKRKQKVKNHTWYALIVSLEVFERARARISKHVGAGQNAAISLLIASMDGRRETKRENENEEGE